jgi:hypothetical protein
MTCHGVAWYCHRIQGKRAYLSHMHTCIIYYRSPVKLLKYTDFMMNAFVNMGMPVYGDIVSNVLIVSD